MGKRGRPKGSKNKKERRIVTTKVKKEKKEIVKTQEQEQIQPQIQTQRKKELWFKFVSKQDTFIDSETRVTCGIIYPINNDVLFKDLIETYKLSVDEMEHIKELFSYLDKSKSDVYSYNEYKSFIQQIDNLINKINSNSLMVRITKTIDEDLDMGTTKIINYKYIIKTKNVDIDDNKNNNKKKKEKVSNNNTNIENIEGKKRGRPKKNTNINKEGLV